MTAVLDARADAETWRGATDFILRIAGLPIEVADGLRFPETTRWADGILAAEAALAAEGGDICDDLATLIGDPANAEIRGKIVALRRDIHNGRFPRVGSLSIVDHLPGDVTDRIRGWLELHAAMTGLLADGAGIVEREGGERRAFLKQVARHPRLRAGLVLGSPTVDAYLPGYLSSGEVLNKRQRRLERTLLDYVYRVACKTSPFSSFTGLARGRIDPAADGGIHTGIVDSTWRSHVQINVAIIGRLVQCIVESEVAFADLRVGLTPGFSQEAERVRFVRRSVARGDDSATVSFDMATDSLFFLKRRETLGFLVELLDGEQAMPASQVVAALAFRTGEDDEICREYVRHLLKIGLLWLPELGVDVFAANPLADFGRQLRALEHLDWASATAAQIDGLAGQVQAYAAIDDLDARRRILGELRTGLTEVFADLGQEGESLPVTLLFEDTTTTESIVGIAADTWARSVIAPLSRIADLLECLDVTLPAKYLMRGFFFTRYGRGGRCDDVIDFLHNFAEDIYDEFGRVSMKMPTYDDEGRFRPLQNWLRVSQVDDLSQARSALVEGMHELWAGHQGSGPVELTDTFIDRVVSQMPLQRKPVRPQGFFLQVGGSAAEPEVVVNRPTGGLLFSFSRFTNAFGTDLVDRLRTYGRSIAGEDAVLAEITGGLNRTNLNVHQPIADYHIVSPAEGSSFPADRQLPLADLYVVHDLDSDRIQLRSRRLGKEVLPIYLGYLMPTALPEVPRNLLLFSPGGMARLDIWGGIPQAEPVGGVSVRPQVRYRNIVVARQTWSLGTDTLPQRCAGEPDATWFLRWRRWQTTHGLPDQVFITLPSSSEGSGSEADAIAAEIPGSEVGASSAEASGGGRRSKPSYLDFTSLFSISVFANEVSNLKGVVEMAEMLPTEEQQYVRSADGHHVCELAVELTRDDSTLAVSK